GDYNHNNIVDAADYSVWRDHLGQHVSTYSGADGNGNGIIDSPDYDVWKANFGHMPGSGSGSAALALTTEAPLATSVEFTPPISQATRTAAAAAPAVAPHVFDLPTIHSSNNETVLPTSQTATAGRTDDALLAWLSLQNHATNSATAVAERDHRTSPTSDE